MPKRKQHPKENLHLGPRLLRLLRLLLLPQLPLPHLLPQQNLQLSQQREANPRLRQLHLQDTELHTDWQDAVWDPSSLNRRLSKAAS